MRYSKQRELILNTVKSTCCHPDAEWIFYEVKRKIPSISLGTVYRNLKNLVNNGDIITLETEIGKVHYDGNTRYHKHFICLKCHTIIDIFDSCEDIEDYKKMGMEIVVAKTIYYGYCKDCQKDDLH